MDREDDSQDTGKQPGEPEEHTADMDDGQQLTEALEATLEGLNRSIEKMEEIVRSIEAGEPDWQQNMELLAEANELASNSNRKLDQVVQDVVYGSDETGEEDDAGSTDEQGD